MITGKESALKWICEQSAAICNHPDVFSCTWIAKDIGESVYKVRKYMQELAQDGYVVKAHEGGYDDWTGRIYCIHGYALTKKGTDHHFYKDYERKEIKLWEEIIHG